jgi:hypothetical protein
VDHLKVYSDPLTEAICQAVEALAVALGEADPARRRVALANAARWVAAAQAACDAAMQAAFNAARPD